MNISHDWLKRFVPHNRTPEEIRDLITAHVATVEGMEHLRSDLEPFVVGRVVESEKIPDTRLSFNKVDDGSGELLEVVCGAPNVAVGTKYPFARTGTVMPGGLKIERRKIRGYTSNGMLCSPRELGLGDDHDGILALDTDAAPGTPLLRVLPAGDIRFIVDVLPNRPDLLSHIGIAREVSALTGVQITHPSELAEAPSGRDVASGDSRDGTSMSGHEKPVANAEGLRVSVEDAVGSPIYTATVIKGVTVGPSPDWLRAAVEAVGGRSINNIVDATNYMLHGYGQPMHAFDKSKLRGNTIIVRRANNGEKLVTLDGAERKLTPDMLVIADAENPTALAGVMGGRESEVTDATVDVVLEVASFNSQLVRSTRRGVNLSSDASYRFERGIDEAAVEDVARLGAALIVSVAGGRVEECVSVGSPPVQRPAVSVRPSRVERVLGDKVSRDEVRSLLESIGFAVTGSGDVLEVTPPSWRHDVSREVDLIEEVARLRGFDRLPDTLQSARPGTVPDHPLFTAYRRVRDMLVSAGLSEVRPLPFTAGEAGEAGEGGGGGEAGGGGGAGAVGAVGAEGAAGAEAVPVGGDVAAESLVRVTNPLAEDEPYLRSNVLDSLARRAEYNLNRMQRNIRIFEIGTVFLKARAEAGQPRSPTDHSGLPTNHSRLPTGHSGLPHEEMRAALLVMGGRRPVHFTEPQPPQYDEWDAKSLAELLVHAAYPGAVVEVVGSTVNGTAAGDSITVDSNTLWSVVADGRSVGSVRRLKLDAPVWASPAFGVEISLGVMPNAFEAPKGENAYVGAGAEAIARGRPVRYVPLPTTPAAEFDLALIVPDTLLAGEVERVIRETAGANLENCVLFDEFRGSGVPEGSRSLAWRLTFRHPERTLRDKEIDGRRTQLLKTLEGKLGVRSRTA